MADGGCRAHSRASLGTRCARPQAAVGAICRQEVAWAARQLVERDELPCFRRLNRSQVTACAAAAGGALTLVQGPPGTGKTHVAIAILIAWVRSGCLGGGAALATSDSNIAVDNLLEGLANAGVRVVRLGRPDSVRPELLQFCPDAGGAGSGDRSADYAAKLAAIKGAQVVCATCVGVGADLLKACRFPSVLVDEATQATEAATLVSLCRGARQMVLLGDHCQLPPTLVSRHPASLSGAAPLFTRLHADGAPSYLLDTQYRMHPAIAQLPADLVYGGHLLSGTPPEERMPPPGFDWPRASMPVAMVPVYGSEGGEGVSKLNRAEAEAVTRVVHGLQYAGVRAADIGVISPYAAQVHLLRSLIRYAATRCDTLRYAATSPRWVARSGRRTRRVMARARANVLAARTRLRSLDRMRTLRPLPSPQPPPLCRPLPSLLSLRRGAVAGRAALGAARVR